jgi:hypothetical protein
MILNSPAAEARPESLRQGYEPPVVPPEPGASGSLARTFEAGGIDFSIESAIVPEPCNDGSAPEVPGGPYLLFVGMPSAFVSLTGTP